MAVLIREVLGMKPINRQLLANSGHIPVPTCGVDLFWFRSGSFGDIHSRSAASWKLMREVLAFQEGCLKEDSAKSKHFRQR